MAIALSWSRLNTYELCPRKFNLQFISKSFREEEKGIHLIKGEQLHKQMEDYANARMGRGTMPLGFSPEVRDTIPYVDRIIEAYGTVYAESQVAAKVDWSPCEWFDKATAWRAIFDLTAMGADHAGVWDYKSGKVYPLEEGFGQLHLSSTVALTRFEQANYVHCAYLYMEHKKVTPIKVFRRSADAEKARAENPKAVVAHLDECLESFNDRFNKVQMETKWDPKPNEFCKWCQATSAQCKFSKKAPR